MILDKKFKGILDAGAGCLIVYDDQAADTTYDQALDTLNNMSKVVDALYVKANKIAAPPEEKKDKDKENADGKDGPDAKKKKKGEQADETKKAKK